MTLKGSMEVSIVSFRERRRKADVPMRRMDIVGIRVELSSNQPAVLLKEAHGKRHLLVFIGAVEGAAIGFALEGIETAKPMTHDLMRDILDAVKVVVVHAEITELRDGVFEAALLLSNGVKVPARASDAFALALRMNAPIDVAEAVLTEDGFIPSKEELDKLSQPATEPLPDDS